MMTLKSCFALCSFIFGIFASQQASEPVSVENEPLHHVMLKNDSVLVIHLTLPPGERTLYHTHVHDRVAIELSNSSTTQQKLSESEGPSSASKPGDFSAHTIAESPFTHRVHNVGSSPYEVLDVELLQRPQIPSPSAAATIAAENPSARVYNWVLAPDSISPMHTHVRPYLIVSATAFKLKMTAPDGQSLTQDLKPGDFHWVNTKVTHALGNVDSAEGQILEVELK